jgi:hypothetical protein
LATDFYKNRFINLISLMDLSYLAGLVDGEGSICLNKVGRKGMQNLHPQISITNTNKEILDWVGIIVGWGTVSGKPRMPRHKPAYNWRINGHLAIQFAKALLPYLRIKKIQATTLIEFEKTIQMKGHRHKLPDNIRLQREDIKNRMTILNMRGNPNG